jgi:hypothetical protein
VAPVALGRSTAPAASLTITTAHAPSRTCDSGAESEGAVNTCDSVHAGVGDCGQGFIVVIDSEKHLAVFPASRVGDHINDTWLKI